MSQVINLNVFPYLKRDIARVLEKRKITLGEKGLSVDIIQEGEYDFSMAEKISRLEEAFSIKTTDGRRIKILDATQIKGVTQDLDILLKTNKKARKRAIDFIEDVNDKKSPLGIAVQSEVEKIKQNVSKFENIFESATDPKAFYNRVIKGKNGDQIEDIINDATQIAKQQGLDLTEEDVRNTIKHLTLEGLFELSQTKTAMTLNKYKGKDIGPIDNSGSMLDNKNLDPVEVNDLIYTNIGDINQFIHLVTNPKSSSTLEAILGDEHLQTLQDIALYAQYRSGQTVREFMANAGAKSITIDSIIARAFNLARGMVSPQYVGAETGARLLVQRNQSIANLALANRDAAELFLTILRDPRSARLTNKEINTLSKQVLLYLKKDIAFSGGEIPTLDEFLGERVGEDIGTKRLEIFVEPTDEERETTDN